ncbi:MAG: hypothetical protein WBJ41_14440 [Chromatiaceae bacterium]
MTATILDIFYHACFADKGGAEPCSYRGYHEARSQLKRPEFASNSEK